MKLLTIEREEPGDYYLVGNHAGMLYYVPQMALTRMFPKLDPTAKKVAMVISGAPHPHSVKVTPFGGTHLILRSNKDGSTSTIETLYTFTKVLRHILAIGEGSVSGHISARAVGLPVWKGGTHEVVAVTH